MPPNIVFITCHDLGKHLGCYGWRSVPSPALDQIAGRGVVFENSFCSAPQCSPSRSALHTGRHAHSNGMMGLAHVPFNWRMHPGEQHLAQRLQAAGYETALIGVQHLVAGDQTHSLGYDSARSRGPARDLAEAAVNFLSAPERQSKPFYLEVGFFEPHRPFDFGGIGADDSKGTNLPYYINDTPEARSEFARVQGAIMALDTAVGQIFAALESSGLLDETWLIFTTDHGLAMPRAKCTCYDPGLETALIMHWPRAGLMGGKRYREMVSHVDLVPTILEGLGLPLSDNLHGRSYWPLLQGDEYTPNEHIFAEKTFHTAYEPMRCIRTATHKLIVNFDQDIAVNVPTDIQKSPVYPQMLDRITPHRPHVELYDLLDDPREMHNLAGEPEAVEIERDLKRRLLDWMETTHDPILQGPVPSPYYREALALLRA